MFRRPVSSERIKKHPGFNLALAASIVVVTAAGVGVTYDVLDDPYRRPLAAAEITLAAIAVVELAARALKNTPLRHGAPEISSFSRMLFRSVAYLILAVAVFSLLSTSVGLAVSLGSITGIMIGFATQNIFGNAVAGILLALGRRFKVGDWIIIAGSTGRIMEISLTYTILQDQDDLLYVPNTTMITSIVRRKAYVVEDGGPPL